MPLNRRQLLAALGASLAARPGLSFANQEGLGTRRFVLVLLRGGADGLAALPSVGDPDYALQRGRLALDPTTCTPLDDTFSLHPALAPLADWYTEGSLLPVHAVGLAYRGRSHFDAQDALENGTAKAQGARDGWLSRALDVRGKTSATALGVSLPLVLRGPAPASSVDPTRQTAAPDAFLEQVAALYSADELLGPALEEARGVQAQVDEAGTAMKRGRKTRKAARLAVSMKAAGELLADPRGPRVLVVEGGGWDTHSRQGVVDGTLARQLEALTTGLTALRTGLATAWDHTTIVCISEFGRTVRPNGTAGSDHGTGGFALLAGGRVNGGRVVADWPGLSPSAQLDGRDLRPTLDSRAVFKAALHGGLGIEDAALDQVVFPGSAAIDRPSGWFRG